MLWSTESTGSEGVLNSLLVGAGLGAEEEEGTKKRLPPVGILKSESQCQQEAWRGRGA